MLTDNKFLALGRMSVDRGRGSRGLEEALGGAQAVSLRFLFCGWMGIGDEGGIGVLLFFLVLLWLLLFLFPPRFEEEQQEQ